MSFKISFTKDNIDTYLKELAKEFRKMNGSKMPAEIILIGGASILINYGFREMTYDMDAIIQAASSMHDAIDRVGDKYDLPNGWLNTDFIYTRSYTPKIVEFSKYYKTFSNVLKVRTVSGVYLLAMKLMAGRQYKNDLLDVIGIILEEKRIGFPIDLGRVQDAAIELYGSYDVIPENSRRFIETALECSDLQELLEHCRQDELESKDVLIEFQNEYPGILNEDNLADVLKAAKAKKKNK